MDEASPGEKLFQSHFLLLGEDMSSTNTIGVLVQKDAHVDWASVGLALEGLFYLEDENKGSAFRGFVLPPVDDGYVQFYQGHDDGMDNYNSIVRAYEDPVSIAAVFSEHLSSGQLLLLYAPQGNPTEVHVIRPGQVTLLTADNVQLQGD